MAIHGLRAEERFEATSREVIDRLGIKLTFGTDFDFYNEIVAQHRPSQPIALPFDPSKNDLTGGNAIWIVGQTEDGALIHTQAFRTVDLKNQSLANYMRRSFRQYPPVGVDIDLPGSRYRPGPGAKTIEGNVVYHGDFWICPETGSFRDGKLSCIIGRVGFLSVIRQWAPDYLFGLIYKPVANKGFPIRLGYMHAEPYAVRWKVAQQQKYLEGVMVYMSLEDMLFVLDMPESEIEALAA